jgi:ribosomal protein S27AE
MNLENYLARPVTDKEQGLDRPFCPLCGEIVDAEGHCYRLSCPGKVDVSEQDEDLKRGR